MPREDSAPTQADADAADAPIPDTDAGGSTERASLSPAAFIEQYEAHGQEYPKARHDSVEEVVEIVPGPEAEPVTVDIKDDQIGRFVAVCKCGTAVAVHNQSALDEMLSTLEGETWGCGREEGHQFRQVSPPR